MTDIRKNPPCEKDCPDRAEGCHGRCERYAAWRKEMDRLMDERYARAEAERGVEENRRRRKEWLRKRGFKV